MDGYHAFTLKRCGALLGWHRKVGYCREPAGAQTEHEGYGPCHTHEGGRRGARAWRWAMTLARQLDVSPWDALLAAVRISAWKVASYELRLAEVEAQHGADALKPGELGHAWVDMSLQERRHLARVAKAAVDAGVAERLIRQVELESQVIVRVLGRTLDDLMNRLEAELGPDRVADLRLAAHERAHKELLALGQPEVTG